MSDQIQYEDFAKIDIRVGKVINTLGVSDENGKPILLMPDKEAPLGSRMF